MRAPAKPKPRAADEVARVIRIARMLEEEMGVAAYPSFGTQMPMVIKSSEPPIIIPANLNLINIAERIAARTEG